MPKKYLIILLLCLSMHQAFAKKQQTKTTPPRLVIMFVIDQGSWTQYIQKLRPHFNAGLHELLNEGIVYTNAHHPHAIPETTTGHHAMSTGALPKDHGGILNQWIDQNYKKIAYDDDHSPEAAVYDSKCPIGKSCKNTMVDGISDQCRLASKQSNRYKVFALAIKSYPAIAMANRRGKALWFDATTGNFTSSKKYFKTALPGWVQEFNKEHDIPKLTSITWQTCYELKDKAYTFPYVNNYDYAGHTSLISRRKKPIAIPIDHSAQYPYQYFMKTPYATKALMDFAKDCLDNNLTGKDDRMLLWISISTLDLAGHIYGPDSLETIDLMYHIDKQIKIMMDHARKKVGAKNCLFGLTADHGIIPIPEISQKRGIDNARRIMVQPLIKAMNKLALKKYRIKEVIKGFEPTYFALNKEALDTLNEDKRENAIKDLKHFLEGQKGIKKVWTAHELPNLSFDASEQQENYYKMQYFKNRMSGLICMTHPYSLLTTYPTGTSHCDPHNDNTQVPLVLYQQGRYEHKTIADRVVIQQLPITLARILEVARPSASSYEVLPGVAW